MVATVIRPALARGEVVVCDRFAASSVAYQGFGRGLGRDLVERANAIATGGLRPDLTLLLDLPAADGLARRAGAGAVNHFDVETLAFHERVRAGYHDLANDAPDSWRVIDASRPIDDVVAECEAAVRFADRFIGAARDFIDSITVRDWSIITSAAGSQGVPGLTALAPAP